MVYAYNIPCKRFYNFSSLFMSMNILYKKI